MTDELSKFPFCDEIADDSTVAIKISGKTYKRLFKLALHYIVPPGLNDPILLTLDEFLNKLVDVYTREITNQH